jgi:hypothetical protein
VKRYYHSYCFGHASWHIPVQHHLSCIPPGVTSVGSHEVGPTCFHAPQRKYRENTGFGGPDRSSLLPRPAVLQVPRSLSYLSSVSFASKPLHLCRKGLSFELPFAQLERLLTLGRPVSLSHSTESGEFRHPCSFRKSLTRIA